MIERGNECGETLAFNSSLSQRVDFNTRRSTILYLRKLIFAPAINNNYNNLLVLDPDFAMGAFEFARKEGFPTQYPEAKTPVTVDVLEAGLILAFVILGTAFLIIIHGFGLKRSTNALVKVLCSITIGCCLMLGNFGQEWEVGIVQNTRAPYRAGSADQMNGSIGIKLGLRSVNVTLKGKGDPHTPLENETINYNERFWWTWDQGRIGFGPYAGLLQQSFREAQLKGLPIPILSVVEYFVVDGEGLRFGRFYRTAGWYTHILMWTAFATWIITNIFLISVGIYAGYFLALTGGLQILACIVWTAVRNPNPLVIPFEGGEIKTSYGSNFWMVLICGIICLLLASVIILMDLRYPDELSAFLELDPISNYDELVIPESEVEELFGLHPERVSMNIEMPAYSESGEVREKSNMRTVLKRRTTVRKAQKSLYRGQMPLPPLPINKSHHHEEDDDPIYENQPVQLAGSSTQRDTSCSREKLCPPPVLPHKRRNKFTNK